VNSGWALITRTMSIAPSASATTVPRNRRRANGDFVHKGSAPSDHDARRAARSLMATALARMATTALAVGSSRSPDFGSFLQPPNLHHPGGGR